MELNTIKPAEGSKKARRRLGRGIGSAWARLPAVVTRARSPALVATTRSASKAVQMPLQRRFAQAWLQVDHAEVQRRITLTDLQGLAGDEVDVSTLKAAGLVPQLDQVGQSHPGWQDRAQGRPQGHRCHQRCQGCDRSRWRQRRLSAATAGTDSSVATNATQLAKSGKFGDLRRRLVFLLLALLVYRIGRTSRAGHRPAPVAAVL